MAINRYHTPAQIDTSWQDFEIPWELVNQKLKESQAQKDLFDQIAAKTPDF